MLQERLIFQVKALGFQNKSLKVLLQLKPDLQSNRCCGATVRSSNGVCLRSPLEFLETVFPGYLL